MSDARSSLGCGVAVQQPSHYALQHVRDREVRWLVARTPSHPHEGGDLRVTRARPRIPTREEDQGVTSKPSDCAARCWQSSLPHTLCRSMLVCYLAASHDLRGPPRPAAFPTCALGA